ncbi:MAG: hypothetical protein U9O55_03760 [Patescibacteria group bacterium]|nr:hypothetical protein [Patescibacteria group bacterium]
MRLPAGRQECHEYYLKYKQNACLPAGRQKLKCQPGADQPLADKNII